MNAQVRNETAKTKKFNSSQENNNKINSKLHTKAKPVIAYDYDAAVSQPDVPNFLGQKYNTSLPIRKKGFYSRGKSKSSIQKTAPTASEEASASSTKSQDKENELQIENTKDTKIDSDLSEKIDVTHGEKETPRIEKISTEDELSAQIFVKNDSLKNEPEEKDRRTPVEQKDKVEMREYVDGAPRSNTLQKRESKIPRTKTSPGLIPVSRTDSAKRLSLTGPKRSYHEIASKKEAKQEEGLKKHAQTKYASSKQFNSDSLSPKKHERKDETIITETSPAVIGCISDPSTFVVLPKLKQKIENESCDDCNPESSYREAEETLSDSRSSPERRYVQRRRRSFKHRKYIDTSSDDFEISSDSSTESREKKPTSTDPVAPVTKSSLATKPSSRSKNRHGPSFSFFNTLFDIVFWPFLFLKSDR